MTEAELDELQRDCPTLYHMAERGSWPSIRRHGLLSTSALLDLHGIRGAERDRLEARRRPDAVLVQGPGLEPATIRDQGPMDDPSLRRCLDPGLEPSDWYRLLNGRVFFWPSPARLRRLLHARPYRGAAHDVLELDTAALVTAWRPAITLSAINSGATRPFPVSRGLATFLPIADYPYAAWRARRPRGERVVELAVAHGVPDVERFVRRVVRMGAGRDDEILFERPPRIAPPAPLL